MKKDKKSENKKEPQQRTENPSKQNAQQEREYREQKDGSMKKSPEQVRGEDAIEKYEDIKSDEKKKEKLKKDEEE